MWTVAQLCADLSAGKTSSRELVEQALARIGDSAGEGRRAFLKVYAEAARADADHADRLRKAGVRRSPVDGLRPPGQFGGVLRRVRRSSRRGK
jgi:aspartyl-tRNA(Asn)/glutamyl-tRNA(Gln) amidotransferase subunit A